MAAQTIEITSGGEYNSVAFADGATYRVHSKDTITVSAMEQLQALSAQISEAEAANTAQANQIQLLIDLINLLAVDAIQEDRLRDLPMAAFSTLLKGMVSLATGIVGEEEEEAPSG